jgi:predicted protein tyrosine phosphatase
MMRVLFVCSRNKLRSPTAEAIFGRRADLETASAGLAADAEEPLTADHLDWADIVFVMEKRHRTLLKRRFGETRHSSAAGLP